MTETSEKHDILKYETDALLELKKDWSEYEREERRRIDFVRGTAFGLVIGIMGNLFVQFISPVIEAVLLEEYGLSFAGNLIMCVVTLIPIVAISSYVYWRQKQDNRRLESTRKNLEIVDYAIRRRQYGLENGEEQQPEILIRKNTREN